MGAGAIILWFICLSILFGTLFGILSGILTKRRNPGSLVSRSFLGFFGGFITSIILFSTGPYTGTTFIWIIAFGAMIPLLISPLWKKNIARLPND